MPRFLLFRLVQSVAVLWAVYTVTFFLLMLAPGDPFIAKDRQPPESVRQALAQKYGLDLLMKSQKERDEMSFAVRLGYISKAYVRYLGNAIRGDLGPSIEYENFTVVDVIRSSLPVSITLGSAALVMALWLGVLTGTLGAVFKNRWPDLGLSVVTLMGVSLPSFVVGSLLLIGFVVVVPIFPAGGWGVTGGTGSESVMGGVWLGLGRIVLPAVTLAIFFLAYIARLTRSSTLDVLSADFVRTARAKGLPPGTVIAHHVGANAALPVLSYLGPAAANVLVGSFIVEKLFAIPGLGTHFVNGCLNKDIPLVLGAVLVYSALVIVFNFLVDLAYAAIDPRITLR
jgi:oligopeptide transport system permease protein